MGCVLESDKGCYPISGGLHLSRSCLDKTLDSCRSACNQKLTKTVTNFVQLIISIVRLVDLDIEDLILRQFAVIINLVINKINE